MRVTKETLRKEIVRLEKVRGTTGWELVTLEIILENNTKAELKEKLRELEEKLA